MRVRDSLYIAFLSLSPAYALKKSDDAVLLSTVKTLTLRADELTTHRRVEALPQLTCKGGNAQGLYEVDVMRCKNAGSEYGPEDISWTCQASLPPEFKLGSTDVICEGYHSADDPYVLRGSCAVEYRLTLTPAGELKYRDHVQKLRTTAKTGWEPGAILFWSAFVALILYAVYHSTQRHGSLPGSFAGRGQGDGTDPPPPYTPEDTHRNPFRSSRPSSWDPRGTDERRRMEQQVRTDRQKTWDRKRQAAYGAQSGGSRFWTGAAAGAAAGATAGYAAGRMQGNRVENAEPGPSGWFGGRTGQASSSVRPNNRASGSSSSTFSESRYESTGFGSTSRR